MVSDSLLCCGTRYQWYSVPRDTARPHLPAATPLISPLNGGRPATCPVSDQRMASGAWLYGSTPLHQACVFSMLGTLCGQGHPAVPGRSSGGHLSASQECSPPGLINYCFFLGPTSKWPHLSQRVWQQTPQTAWAAGLQCLACKPRPQKALSHLSTLLPGRGRPPS